MSSCNLPTTPSCSAPWVPCSIVAACSAGCRREPPRRFRAPSCGKWCVTWPWRLGDPWNPPGDSGRVPHGDIISPWSRRSSKMIENNIWHFSPLIVRCLPTDIPLSMVPYCHDWRWRDDCIWESGVAWCDMPCSYAGALAGRLEIWSPNWAAQVLGDLFGPKLWPSFLKRIGHFVWVEHFNKMTRFPRPGGRFSFSNLTMVCGVIL